MAHNLQTLANNNYSWVDALFMGMGNWPRAYARTNAEAYLQKMDSLYESTRDTGCGAVGMYNAGDGLWYRDCGFVGKTDTNGQPIYWSRGNGWVMGALAEVLQSLPLGNSHRLQYEQMLQTMAAALVPLQGNDGMWRSSLRDPALYPQPETSGTALITYGLAYGVRAGVLDRSTYLPVVTKAWQGLSSISIRSTGFISGCQPPSNQPGTPYTGTAPRVSPTASSPGTLFTDESSYCIGGVLLAVAAVAPLFDPHPGDWGAPPGTPPPGGWGNH
jgi:rhamnogalacturonyl hydrolase YesR